MRPKLISAVAGLALAIPLALLAPGTANAVDGCNNGSGSGSFALDPGGVQPNTNAAWRFRALRVTNSGQTDVNGFSPGGTMPRSYTGSGAWIGYWSSNYPRLATSENVVNVTGGGSVFNYNRSCDKV